MDRRLYRWINRFADHTGWLHGIGRLYANTGIALFAVLLLAAYLDRRHAGDVRGVAITLWTGAAAVVALGIGQLIGNAVDRARPYAVMSDVHVLIDRTKDFSFPSDHATVAGAVAGGLLLASRRWGAVATVCAVLMAFVRVYVGAHYPGDVLAGLALGAAIAVAGVYAVVPLVRRGLDGLRSTALRPVITSGR